MSNVDVTAATTQIRRRLLDSRNSDGGWPYTPGKRSRLEPTCWALLSLAPTGGPSGATAVFSRWWRDKERFVDGPSLPPNNVSNALATLTLLQDGKEGDRLARPVIDALVASKGITTARSDSLTLDSTLPGWGWVDGTASWVEPTAWCVLLLKRLRKGNIGGATLEGRIDFGDRLLLDRACRDGGWNYGNAIVFEKELWAYAQTTAIALIALQDHSHHPIVRQALYRLGRDARREASTLALSLAIMCLRVYGISPEPLEQQLAILATSDIRSESSSDILGLALSLCALGSSRAHEALTI